MTVKDALIRQLDDLDKRTQTLESREVRRLITDYPWLRGWHDDFWGDQLKDEYELWTGGAASTVQLQWAANGVVRLRCDLNLGNWANLVLGDSADNFLSLDITEGWIMLWRAQIPILNQLQALGGGLEATTNHKIVAGFRATTGANWIISCTDAGGTTDLNTGVAADTDWHWHALKVYRKDGVDRVEYSLDGTLIGTNLNSVPVNRLTPMLLCGNVVGGNRRNHDIDSWDVIPLNLA